MYGGRHFRKYREKYYHIKMVDVEQLYNTEYYGNRYNANREFWNEIICLFCSSGFSPTRWNSKERFLGGTFCCTHGKYGLYSVPNENHINSACFVVQDFISQTATSNIFAFCFPCNYNEQGLRWSSLKKKQKQHKSIIKNGPYEYMHYVHHVP